MSSNNNLKNTVICVGIDYVMTSRSGATRKETIKVEARIGGYFSELMVGSQRFKICNTDKTIQPLSAQRKTSESGDYQVFIEPQNLQVWSGNDLNAANQITVGINNWLSDVFKARCALYYVKCKVLAFLPKAGISAIPKEGMVLVRDIGTPGRLRGEDLKLVYDSNMPNQSIQVGQRGVFVRKTSLRSAQMSAAIDGVEFALFFCSGAELSVVMKIGKNVFDLGSKPKFEIPELEKIFSRRDGYSIRVTHCGEHGAVNNSRKNNNLFLSEARAWLRKAEEKMKHAIGRRDFARTDEGLVLHVNENPRYVSFRKKHFPEFRNNNDDLVRRPSLLPFASITAKQEFRRQPSESPAASSSNRQEAPASAQDIARRLKPHVFITGGGEQFYAPHNVFSQDQEHTHMVFGIDQRGGAQISFPGSSEKFGITLALKAEEQITNSCFPLFEKQKLNEELKRMCREAGLCLVCQCDEVGQPNVGRGICICESSYDIEWLTNVPSVSIACPCVKRAVEELKNADVPPLTSADGSDTVHSQVFNEGYGQMGATDDVGYKTDNFYKMIAAEIAAGSSLPRRAVPSANVGHWAMRLERYEPEGSISDRPVTDLDRMKMALHALDSLSFFFAAGLVQPTSEEDEECEVSPSACACKRVCVGCNEDRSYNRATTEPSSPDCTCEQTELHCGVVGCPLAQPTPSPVQRQAPDARDVFALQTKYGVRVSYDRRTRKLLAAGDSVKLSETDPKNPASEPSMSTRREEGEWVARLTYRGNTDLAILRTDTAREANLFCQEVQQWMLQHHESGDFD